MEKQNFFTDFKDLAEEYFDDRILLYKLQLTEKAAKLSSVGFLMILIGFFGLIIFMILSFIGGYLLSSAVGSLIGGFAILAGIYMLFIVVLIIVHKKYTKKKVIDRIIQFSFEQEDN